MRNACILLSLISLCLLALQPGCATSNSDNSSGPGVALTREAIALGVEPSTLGELWRTKQPVIVTKTDPQGGQITTTYELSADGQHISTTSHKVEQVNAPKPPATEVQQLTNPQSDWEYVPRNTNKMISSSPFGENWPKFGSPSWPSFEIPQTSTGGQGRTVTTTTRVFSGPAVNSWSTGTDLGFKWPDFNFPTGVTPQTTTNTERDGQGRTVTTVTKTYPVVTSFSSGAQPAGLPTNWNGFNNELPPWFKNTNFGNELPSLIPTPAAQPVPMPTRPTVLPQPPLPTAVPSDQLYTTTPLPSLEEFLRQMPKNTNVDEPTVNRTRITSVNFNAGSPLNVADQEPLMRDILDRAGITDDDLQNARAQGNDLVRTRVLPDGRTVTTTVRVKNRVDSPPPPLPAVLLPTAPPRQDPPVQQQDNSIDDYLSQVRLTPSDIQAQNGEVIKTLVDKNGRVLSVKFVLSTVKGDEQGQGQVEQSNK